MNLIERFAIGFHSNFISFLQHFYVHSLQETFRCLSILTLILLRWTVGLGSYSGEATPPNFGDFEAQRHWMEVTQNTPMDSWYFNTTSNDLSYWGLDYPPLSAFFAYAFGSVFKKLEPDMIRLTTSRGYETPTGKVYMRLSVIASDIAVFIPAIVFYVRSAYKTNGSVNSNKKWILEQGACFLILAQPGFLLIDHGHFQYNNVSLGFVALASAFIHCDHEFLATIAYCLALNFKQMTLYYAPAFGMYFFSKCLYRKNFILHFAKLAAAVILTFLCVWLPFCVYHRSDTTCVSSMMQVIRRVFPVGRGLIEDKVSNFWCVIELVYKVRRRVHLDWQLYLCLFMTILSFTPSVLDLLRRRPTKLRLLLSLVNSSLSFYLFSFMVHEKTILFVLLPIALLVGHCTLLSGLFGSVAAFSMFFLMRKDNMVLEYIAIQIFHAVVGISPFLVKSFQPTTHPPVIAPGYVSYNVPSRALQAFMALSLVGMLILHLMQWLMPPPVRLPHIHEYLFAIYSCGQFLLSLCYFTYWQWTVDEEQQSQDKKQS